MKKQAGFTLIELVMVIVILGILGAIAVPRFVNLQGNALTAAQQGMSGAVKAAHAIAIADLQRFPTVAELAGYVQGENVAANAGGTGIDVDINGTIYTVPTFGDASCTPANQTAAAGASVLCVGTI